MLERPGATSYVDRYEWQQKRDHYLFETARLANVLAATTRLIEANERAVAYCSDVLIGDLTPTEADELIRTERGA
jgi:hypothetical protein